MRSLRVFVTIVFLCVFTLTACTSSISSGENLDAGEVEDSFFDPQELSPANLTEGEALQVVATTNIVGNVISNVGGDAIQLTSLLPINADPHAYEPTPSDLRAISHADVVFINGLGLEEFLEEMLKNVGVDVPIISLSDGIEALTFEEDPQLEDSGKEEHNQHIFDPHVWLDPMHVAYWTDRAAQTLSALDPKNTALYLEQAGEYKKQLIALDEWIMEKVSQIPAENRMLVTDHRDFDYFAARYGFDVIGAVIPAYSSASEPSAQDIAQLQMKVNQLGVKTLFVGVTINPNLVRALVEDTGIEMVRLYTGSLSGPEGPAGSYIDLMEFNTESIVNALLY